MNYMPRSDLRDTRILFVIEKLAERSGGAERVMIETANALHARGYAIEIVSHEPRGKKAFYPIVKGIIHTNIRPRDHYRSRIRRLFDRARKLLHKNRYYWPGLSYVQWLSEHGGFRWRLARYIDATRPDVVIAFLPPAVTAVSLAKMRHTPRLFASLHNVPAQDFDNPKRWDANPVDRSLRKSALKRFDVIGILLPEFLEWFPRELQDQVVVIPNAVRPADPAQVANAQRRKCVISVGRLAEVKRHHLLIEAWSYLKPVFPDWTCEIYGVGPKEEELKQLIAEHSLQEHVFLRGHRSDIQNVYLSSSVLAHPAEFEGFGLVITEALAHGLPVVGFEDCSGFNFIVHDNICGLFVDSKGDRATNLSSTLAKLMGDSELCQTLGRQGICEIERFREDKILDQWETAIGAANTRISG